MIAAQEFRAPEWVSLTDRAQLGPTGFACAVYWMGANSRQLHSSVCVGAYPGASADGLTRERKFLRYTMALGTMGVSAPALRVGEVIAFDLRCNGGPAAAIAYLGSVTRMVGDSSERLASHFANYYLAGRERIIADGMWNLWELTDPREPISTAKPTHYWRFDMDGLTLSQIPRAVAQAAGGAS